MSYIAINSLFGSQKFLLFSNLHCCRKANVRFLNHFESNYKRTRWKPDSTKKQKKFETSEAQASDLQSEERKESKSQVSQKAEVYKRISRVKRSFVFCPSKKKRYKRCITWFKSCLAPKAKERSSGNFNPAVGQPKRKKI